MPPIIDPEKCDRCAGRKYQICVEHCGTDVFRGSRQGELPVILFLRSVSTKTPACWTVQESDQTAIPLAMTVAYR